MKLRMTALVALLVAAAPAAAQQHAHGAGGDHMAPGIRPLYDMVKGYITRAAEQMPEADYSFKPTPEVRSFGQLLGHIANSATMFCSMGSGEANPNQGTNHEQTTAKAGLVKAVNDAFAYCDRAYATGDSKLMEKVNVFGQEQDRFYALVFNIAHLNEHYGNIVTYMRLKGMVPPSSQR